MAQRSAASKGRLAAGLLVRVVGTLGAGLSALMASILVVNLFAERAPTDAWWWLVAGPVAVIVSWIGVWAWWRSRWALAAMGMWVAAVSDIAWYSAAILPLLLAIVASVLAFRRRDTPSRSNGMSTVGVGLLMVIIATVAPASAQHVEACEGVAPEETYCRIKFIATDDVVGVSIRNRLELGVMTASVIRNGELVELIVCEGYGLGHHCDDFGVAGMPSAGDDVTLEVRAEGEGAWRIALLYGH